MSASIEITPEPKNVTKVVDFVHLHAPKQAYAQSDALLLIRLMREQSMKKVRLEFIDNTWNVRLVFQDREYTGASPYFWKAFNIAHDQHEAWRGRREMN